MSSQIESLERTQLRRVPEFRSGDRLRVHFQVVEGSRRRVQVFEGVVIKRQGHGVREVFTVRKQSFGVGVERTFPLHSPKIEKIEVAARGDVRRAKLYYLRDRVGKRARVRERSYVGPEEEVTAGLLHEAEETTSEEPTAAVEDSSASAEVEQESIQATDSEHEGEGVVSTDDVSEGSEDSSAEGATAGNGDAGQEASAENAEAEADNESTSVATEAEEQRAEAAEGSQESDQKTSDA